MPTSRVYVTTARGSLPELVQADTLARHWRMRGSRVRFMVSAKQALALREPLGLSFNDFASTGGRLSARLRLSEYVDRVRALIANDELRIAPESHREHVLTANVPESVACQDRWRYLGSLDESHYQRWWATSTRRIHVISQDLLLEHALFWPALLLSEGRPLPTEILVTDGIDDELVDQYDGDTVRWCLLRYRKFTARGANEDLARGLGNLVDRTTTMIHRYRDGQPPPTPVSNVWHTVPDEVHQALVEYDFQRAIAAVWQIVEQANRILTEAKPWQLASAEQAGDAQAGSDLDTVLATALRACRTLASELTPFVPDLAAKIAKQCIALSGPLAPQRDLVPRRR